MNRGQREDWHAAAARVGEPHVDTGGKKTAAAIPAEITRAVDPWLHVLCNGQRKTGNVDLEASEMRMRSAMHRVGAAGLTPLLRFPVPPAGQRTVACSCGRTAHYQELRSQSIRTAVGRVEVSRPYDPCPHCHNGQFPADVPLDRENQECSPGVRGRLAGVGPEAPFDHGRQPMKSRADLEVTSQAVEPPRASERTSPRANTSEPPRASERTSPRANTSQSSGPCSWI